MECAEAAGTLDLVAIADHDQVRGALEAVEWCAGRPGGAINAIVATEVTTAWGRHVLALFFEPPFPTVPLPRFRSLPRTIRQIEELGGLAVIPHPLSNFVPSVGKRSLSHLLHRHGLTYTLCGIEVCSGVVGGRRAVAHLRHLNATRWDLAEIGGSDAHHVEQIGLAYTTFPGTTPGDLCRAIRQRATGAHWGAPVQVSARAHARQNWRSLIVKPARELRAALIAAK
jgi:hypothetical protein